MFEQQDWRRLQENNQLEAKEAAGGLPKSIWETYSAFANTKGGVILLGMREESDRSLTASGVANPERMVKAIWDTLNNHNKVSANVLDEDDIAIETIGQARIIRINVPRARREDRPVYINGNPIGGTYRRNFEGDYQCSHEQYAAMMRDNNTDTANLDHKPLERFTPDDLNQTTVQSYRNLLRSTRPNHPWLELDTEEFLLRLNALARDRDDNTLRPTRAGLLVFGNDWRITEEFPYYFLDYRESINPNRRWDHRITSGDGEWSGNLFDFYNRVWPRLSQVLTRPFALDEHSRRVDDTPMHAALREALANTLIHADYYLRGNTVITRHTDRIEFANPGGLRIPPEVAMAGGLSDSRNPAILKMFALISVVERAGSGFDAMRAGCDWAGIPHPDLTESFDPDRTQLVFHLSIDTSAPPTQQTPKTSNLAEPEQQSGRQSDIEKLLQHLRQHGPSTRTELEQLLGVGPTWAKRLLADLMDAGLVRREGKSRATRYIACEPTDRGNEQGS